MNKSLLTLATLGILACGALNAAAQESEDRAALVAFYHATDGPNWKNNTNWLSDKSVIEWHGVSAHHERRPDGRLTALHLDSNNLTGMLPPEIGDLTTLKNLHLPSNNLTGPIPATIGNLTDLQVLYVNDNSLTGPLPSSMLNLRELGGLFIRFNDGLCVPADEDFEDWMREIVEFEGEICEPPVAEQTQAECLDDAGVPSSASSPEWDPMVGRCVAAEQEDIESIGSFADRCRECWKLYGDDSAQARGPLKVRSRELQTCLQGAKSFEDTVISIAGAGAIIAGIGGFGGIALGFGAFYVTMTFARHFGPPPGSVLIRELLEVFAHNVIRFRPPSSLMPSSTAFKDGDYTLKAQSTNPDALAFGFADNGDLEFHYGSSEPTAFIWTLMEGDTPVGSLVIPYTPSPVTVPALPLVGSAVLALALGMVGWIRRR